VKIVNKSNNLELYELSVEGLPGAVLTEADEGLGPAGQLGLPVKADSVGTFRVMIAGQPASLHDGEQAITFMLSNTTTGENTVYRSLFMGPGATERRPGRSARSWTRTRLRLALVPLGAGRVDGRGGRGQCRDGGVRAEHVSWPGRQ
jgi:hypothetical protein